MKKIKLALLTLIPAALSFSLAACSGCSNTNKDSSGSGGDSSGDSSAIPEGYVRVTFYIDYNQPNTDAYYDRKDVKIGEVVAEPTKPTEAPLPQFPVFAGWSEKEMIKDSSDLWNFSSSKVNPEEGTNTFTLYGIWLAEGEQA